MIAALSTAPVAPGMAPAGQAPEDGAVAAAFGAVMATLTPPASPAPPVTHAPTPAPLPAIVAPLPVVPAPVAPMAMASAPAVPASPPVVAVVAVPVPAMSQAPAIVDEAADGDAPASARGDAADEEEATPADDATDPASVVADAVLPAATVVVTPVPLPAPVVASPVATADGSAAETTAPMVGRAVGRAPSPAPPVARPTPAPQPGASRSPEAVTAGNGAGTANAPTGDEAGRIGRAMPVLRIDPPRGIAASAIEAPVAAGTPAPSPPADDAPPAMTAAAGIVAPRPATTPRSIPPAAGVAAADRAGAAVAPRAVGDSAPGGQAAASLPWGAYAAAGLPAAVGEQVSVDRVASDMPPAAAGPGKGAGETAGVPGEASIASPSAIGVVANAAAPGTGDAVTAADGVAAPAAFVVPAEASGDAAAGVIRFRGVGPSATGIASTPVAASRDTGDRAVVAPATGWTPGATMGFVPPVAAMAAPPPTIAGGAGDAAAAGLDLEAMFPLAGHAPLTVSFPRAPQPAAPVGVAPAVVDPATADPLADAARPDDALSILPAGLVIVPQAAVPAADTATAVATSADMPADAGLRHHLDVAHDGAWLDRLAHDIAASADTDHRMRFQLNPERLGALHVEIAGGGDGASVRFTADSEAARTLIADAQPRLVAEARAQGMRIADTQVDLSGRNAGSGGDAGAGQGNANPFAQGQQAGQQQRGGGQRASLFDRATAGHTPTRAGAVTAGAERYA